MRLKDLKDYITLRSIAANPWEIVRFRKTQRLGQILEAKLLDEPSLYIRGGRADHTAFRRIYLYDEYRLNKHRHATWDCVVDLGANVGFFSCRIAPGARKVFCYEPIRENFAELERNAESRPNIFPVREAVAGKTGTLRLYRPKYNRWTGRYSMYHDTNPNTSEEFEEVPSITLEQLFSRHGIARCDLLKIDVEGAEYEILWATPNETYSKIYRICGEYHGVHPNRSQMHGGALGSFLRSKGFEVELVPRRKRGDHGLFFAVKSGED